MKLVEECDLLEEKVYDDCSECYRLDICLIALFLKEMSDITKEAVLKNEGD